MKLSLQLKLITKLLVTLIVYFSLPVILLQVDAARGWSFGGACENTFFAVVIAIGCWMVYAYYAITITIGIPSIVRKYLRTRKEAKEMSEAINKAFNDIDINFAASK